MINEGMVIGERYEIVGRVGSGGMSEVYKGKDLSLNRYVAIKVLKREYSNDKNFLSKFRTEAQSAAGLTHPNIVSVYDVGADKDLHYIVMELVEGITLKSYIEKKNRLNMKEAVSIAIQVSMGIEAAHANHIIHRDIKPQNIIISKEGKVKVTDFGIAKAATSHTISSNIMGSVHYASPEQSRGGYIDEKSDVYSLGITLYEMVTGRVPFDGESAVEIAIKHLQDEIEPPSTYAPDLPISVEKIILKCTQKSPDQRYMSFGELISDLKHSLMSPDEDFVKFTPLTSRNTKVYDDEAAERLRRGNGIANVNANANGNSESLTELFPDSSYEKNRGSKETEKADGFDPNVEKHDYDNDEDAYIDDGKSEYDEYPDDLDDDSDDGELNPKIEKVITVLGIIAGIIIVIIVLYIVGNVMGIFKFGPSSKNEDTAVELTQDTSDEEEKEEKVKVTSVVGMDYEDAAEFLKEKGLGISKKSTEASDIYPEDAIIFQEIQEGTEVEKNTTIPVVVSSGQEKIFLNDVKGEEAETAMKKLKEQGVEKTATKYEYSTEVEEGCVISMSPSAGSSITKNETVTLTISQGPEILETTVPALYNTPEAEARNALDANHLTCTEVQSQYNNDIAQGNVIYQSIEAGSVVEQGTGVLLIVSAGPDPALQNVPYVGSITIRTKDLLIPEDGAQVRFELVQNDSTSTVYDQFVTPDSDKIECTMPGISGVNTGKVNVYVNDQLVNGYDIGFTPQQ